MMLIIIISESEIGFTGQGDDYQNQGVSPRHTNKSKRNLNSCAQAHV